MFVGAAMAWYPYLDFSSTATRTPAQWAALELSFTSSTTCAECHETEHARLVSRDPARHRLRELPRRARASTRRRASEASAVDGRRAVPTDEVCVRCHRRRGPAAGFRQIVPAQHYVSSCLECHDPHTGIANRPPVVLHPLDNLPPCITCHGPEGFKARNQRHPDGSDRRQQVPRVPRAGRGPAEERERDEQERVAKAAHRGHRDVREQSRAGTTSGHAAVPEPSATAEPAAEPAAGHAGVAAEPAAESSPDPTPAVASRARPRRTRSASAEPAAVAPARPVAAAPAGSRQPRPARRSSPRRSRPLASAGARSWASASRSPAASWARPRSRSCSRCSRRTRPAPPDHPHVRPRQQAVGVRGRHGRLHRLRPVRRRVQGGEQRPRGARVHPDLDRAPHDARPTASSTSTRPTAASTASRPSRPPRAPPARTSSPPSSCPACACSAPTRRAPRCARSARPTRPRTA